MGMIIPPSIPIVIFAVTAQESVGKLFLGGVIPGLLVGVIQLGLVVWISREREYPVEDVQFSGKEVVRELRGSLPVLIMPLFVVGSVVGGFATATESAGLGIMYAAFVGFAFTKHLTIANCMAAMRSAASTSAKNHDHHRLLTSFSFGF